MKKIVQLAFSALLLFIGTMDKQVYAVEMWDEGTHVANGFYGLVNGIIASGADVALITDVRNIEGDFMQRLANALSERESRFHTYHSLSASLGVISRFPIRSHFGFDSFSINNS